MADEKIPRVLVIGAGPAGLLTAHALQMQGAHVTVYEQDSALDARPRDWNFGIYWAQVPLHECLPEELQKEVENAQVDGHRAGSDETMPIYNGLTEELMTAPPIPHNIRLARRRFIRLITKGVDVKYGKKIKQVSSDGESATATFEDGTSATGNLVVGAEGAHSIVRESLLAPEKAALEYSPLVASVVMAKLPEEAVAKFKEMTNRLMVVFHPDGYFNWIGIHEANDDLKPGEWTFMMIMSWSPDDANYDPNSMKREDILPDMKRRAEIFGDRLKYIWQSVPDATQAWHNRLSYWRPESWDNKNGTVTLVGDAAHSMTFHRGQGLNNAIHDVASLASKTKEHGFSAAAVKAYEEEMIPRGQEAVVGSNMNSLAVHDWEKLLESPLFKQGLKQK